MTERIQAIMNAKGMAQNVFAQTLGISAATISSLFTGRTKPTNNHVQAIHRAFPEINTNWLMFGEGDMYVDGRGEEAAPLADDGEGYGEQEEAISAPASTILNDGEDSLSLFPEMPTSSASSAARPATSTSSGIATSELAEVQAMMLAELSKMKNSDKRERKIKEIRVFYDDGTFEAFSPIVK